MTGSKEYKVAIYCRLSKEDEKEDKTTESSSIATQKSILTDYVHQHGWHIVDIYADDGYSGTNFNRPDFQRMIADIEKGLINCVITKDLSRLGRNYLDCGLYLEVFFPEHNVRYISVTDGVDTLNKSAMDITPFRNILNEMYAADISTKIRSAYKARFNSGKFMGTSAPYGYRKDPNDKNHLIIDEVVAPVVKKMFSLALEGNGIAKIRKYLNANHILRPAAYAVTHGETGYERYFEDNDENRYIWSENSVRQILRSEVYAGNLVGYKRTSVNMKSKKRPSKLPEDWEVIRGTHEGIVTQDEFDTVQRLMTSRRKEPIEGGFDNIFAGLLYCADCGYAMRAMSAHRRKRPELIDCIQYTCNNYSRYGNLSCTSHTIEARDLYTAVLNQISYFADIVARDENVIKTIRKKLALTENGNEKSLEREKRKLTKRLLELDKLFSALYEDRVMEKITERNYTLMSSKYETEQVELEARLNAIETELTRKKDTQQSVMDFISLVGRFKDISSLNATILNALIDKITVSERVKSSDGTVQQTIRIYFKFVGLLDELHIIPIKRYSVLPQKECACCGVMFTPGSAVAKYCSTCSKEIRKKQSNESKRRSRARQKAIA